MKNYLCFSFKIFQKKSLYSDENRKDLLFFKDENSNDFIKESIGLRIKLFVIKTVSNQEEKSQRSKIEKLEINSYEKYKKCQKDLKQY